MLAGTRFVLAAIVFFGHLYQCTGDQWSISVLGYNLAMLSAVIAFFVISGFSIAHSISTRPRGFYARRIWRIWPVYLACFGMAVVVAYRFSPRPSSGWQVLANLFMLQGLLAPVLEANAASWTLAIEEWLYVLAPAFRRLPAIVLCALAAASAYWYAIAADQGVHRFTIQVHGISFAAFAWPWLFGFVFYFYRDNWLAKAALLILPVLLICRANELGGKYAPLTMAATLCVIIWGGRIRLNDPVRSTLTYLGNLSYPLYLVHYPIFIFLRFVAGSEHSWHYVFLSLAATHMVYKYVDAPNRYRWKQIRHVIITPPALPEFATPIRGELAAKSVVLKMASTLHTAGSFAS
jgi:peptidoglycan/LPS O-acetylase OafA/YrhL